MSPGERRRSGVPTNRTMHHIDPNELPLRLAQHGIYPQKEERTSSPRSAIPALPHWQAALASSPRTESRHDFLVLGNYPET